MSDERTVRAGEYAELPDGRALCLECASTAVMDSQTDAPRLYDDVCVFLANRGLPLLPQRPPLHLVAQDAINDANDKEGWHRGRAARTRGLCLFEVGRGRRGLGLGGGGSGNVDEDDDECIL